jgi:hypothetical protein
VTASGVEQWRLAVADAVDYQRRYGRDRSGDRGSHDDRAGSAYTPARMQVSEPWTGRASHLANGRKTGGESLPGKQDAVS